MATSASRCGETTPALLPVDLSVNIATKVASDPVPEVVGIKIDAIPREGTLPIPT